MGWRDTGQETAYGDTGRPAIDSELLLAVMRIGYVGGSPVRATWWRNYACTGLGEVSKQRHGTLSEPGMFGRIVRQRLE